ncbi:MAG: GNAT family N-acetyltransferase [Candidatus Thermoplasmatota archaeon]|nr:GNAT family N-acetyltransferase [Candidatus Thermoplasmatota archaeon]
MVMDPSAKNGSLKLKKVSSDDDTRIENTIRNSVFVIEQNVQPEIEYDEFENESIHYLILDNERPVGCIRYRWKGPDIKIERLAVLEDLRKKGYGAFAIFELLKIILDLGARNIYLHSQVIAKEFYQKCGFSEVGPVFKEADIDHVKMYYRKE